MEHKNYQLSFKGQGKELFSILIVNWLLTAITLGLYYPWAKAKVLKYMYANTELEQHPFAFHGTGKEMFVGFIKGILLFLLLFAVYAFCIYQQWIILGVVALYGGLLGIIPLAIHGTLRYRMSRSSYRGIHFGYRGDKGELYKMFIGGFLLTLVTLTIYGSWFEMNLRRYTQGKSRYGSSEFKFDGQGNDWFWLNLKGIFLSAITLYIYMFKWIADRFNYQVEHSSWHSGESEIQFRGTATGMAVFELVILNALIVVFSLGLATAWAEVRTAKFIADNIKLEGNVDLDQVVQTEAEHKDAMADELLDMMDMNIFF